MKIIVTAILSFLTGVGVTYFIALYSYVALAQQTTQAKVLTESALIEFLELENYNQVKEILNLSLCANRDYLREESDSFFWRDKAMSNRFLESTSMHCEPAT